MKKLALLSLALIAFIQIDYCQTIPDSALYLGQTPPGNTPMVFAPGIISISGRKDKVITISPDGQCLFYSVGEWPNCRTMFMEYKNGNWTNPVTASFSKTRSVDEPIFAPDGKRIYYYAYNAPNSFGGADICYSVRVDSLWNEPINVGSSLNSAGDEYHPCIVNDSSIYFDNTSGGMYRAQYINGVYQPRVMLPSPINPNSSWGDCYVSPDESYMIFTSYSRGGFGGYDNFISYKKANGTWTNPKNIGSKVNTSADESGGDITADGKYMTFGRNDDIYWVSASFIDSLKQTNFIPYVKNNIKMQTDTLGNSFSYMVPDSIFIDDDGNNTLAYSASLNNGDPLPSWLSFDNESMTFSGTLTESGSFRIKVAATDTAGASASNVFALQVVEKTSSVRQTIEHNIQVFPNPTNDRINISFGSITYKNAVVELTDINGRSIISNNFHNTSATTIALTGYPQGYYLLIINIDGEKINKKICLE
jgi:hypothetical protein